MIETADIIVMKDYVIIVTSVDLATMKGTFKIFNTKNEALEWLEKAGS